MQGLIPAGKAYAVCIDTESSGVVMAVWQVLSRIYGVRIYEGAETKGSDS